MPAVAGYTHAIPAVAEFGQLLLQLLDEAEAIKGTSGIEPPLTSSDFENLKPRVTAIFGDVPLNERSRQYARTEVAARDIFCQLVAKTEISSPEFVKIWNLLDILSILCDSALCDAPLVFWLVEELLESQTIDGCRKILDFLESRRERLTSKHFKLKHLVILRSCNDLLRRLSRAKDTSFCGRVFIFLFQSFPLGDKSSVNLRGEYHTENVTTYDKNHEDLSNKMDVDDDSGATVPAKNGSAVATSNVTAKGRDTKDTIDMDTLYPTFWSLQDFFSQPKKLFDHGMLEEFKKSLEATVKAMKANAVTKGSIQPKASSDENKQPSKKMAGEKEGDEKDELSSTFNPKYLTSRHLFELEIGDWSFQRHVLVQALIIMDFLISLSEPEKEKIAGISKKNNAVIYQDQTLSREDTQWAVDMRRTIQDFLINGPEGAFFYRMVDSILTRDKNWVRWKMESCPPIELPPISAEEFLHSKSNIEKVTSKRPKLGQAGSMDMGFLQRPDPKTMWDRFKNPNRFKLPDLKTYEKKIADAKFGVDMAVSAEDKMQAEEVLAAQTWRAFRIAGSRNIASFDKVDDYKNADAIFKDPAEQEEEEKDTGPKAPLPKDTRALLISGPSGVGTMSIIRKLLEKYAGAFKICPRLTSRKEADGEVKDDAHTFVPKADIDAMMDREQLIEFEDAGEHIYATNRTKVDAIRESGKVPVLRLNPVQAQSIKDWDYPARFIFISPPSIEELRNRLEKKSGLSENEIDTCIESAEKYMREAADEKNGLFDTTIVNDDLDKACAELGAYVYGEEEKDEPANGGEGLDVDMKDTAGDAVGGEAAAPQQQQQQQPLPESLNEEEATTAPVAPAAAS